MDSEQMQERETAFYTDLFSPASMLMPVRACGMNSQFSVGEQDWPELPFTLTEFSEAFQQISRHQEANNGILQCILGQMPEERGILPYQAGGLCSSFCVDGGPLQPTTGAQYHYSAWTIRL